ncbi:FkbM family methyltransferase [Pseudomonas sp. RIT-PI-AD]|uniref:FkbM family methyltransferase n=1 Tax=Pseudomonas sp. RIT-PI-AD TaxID=3035294 RepID=UPI0021DA694A|nr:FkbM family methyltransferase [Pseudomonas sp. RIT-PI-AD]
MAERRDPAELRAILQVSLAHARRDGVAIFGAGVFARALRRACEGQGIRVRCFVVSGHPADAQSDGLPVYGLGGVPAPVTQGPILIGVYNRNAESELTALRRRCLDAGFAGVHVPQEYFSWVAAAMGWRYWLAPLEDYPAMGESIEAARACLADQASREAFAAILDFRQALALERPLALSAEPQYFPPSLRHAVAQPCVYLDGGAYDGDSVQMAAEVLALERIYAFEPDPGNYPRLVARMGEQGLPAVSLPVGLSDSTACLRFNAGAGEGSSLDPQGDTLIQVIRLDDLLAHERVDFLKLDIEGNEMQALEGARRLLLEQGPFLAIAAYHRWDDLWRIPTFIHGLGLGYKITLKLHETNSFESVFYAHR